MESFSERLLTFPVEEEYLRIRDQKEFSRYLNDSLSECAVETIGRSREGHELWGVSIGEGPEAISVIAGCHADEPVGPMTAQALPLVLRRSFPELLERYTFHIVPQMNPDGANQNRAWFELPLDPQRFLDHAVRELPGDDIEFGFGDLAGVRPECRAAQEFLGAYAPLVAHFSLHGLGFAEGVWCLIGRDWEERSSSFRRSFSEVCGALDYPQLDIDRKGEKGFQRIEKGFSTTPRSSAMKEFFLERNDSAMAAKFYPNSMEWVGAQGGKPLCIVSEVPLFTVRSSAKEEANAFRARLDDARPKGESAVGAVLESFGVTATPLELQMRLQVAMIVLAIGHL